MERKKISLDDTNESQSQKVAENAYAQLVKIVNVEDMSNYPHMEEVTPAFKSGFKPQLLLKITYSSDGRESNFLVFGQYEVENGMIKEWNRWKGNGVHMFLGTIYGEYELEHDWTIPFDVLTGCIGKQIKIVRYMQDKRFDYDAKDGSKRASWTTWGTVFSEDSTIDEIKVEFERSMEYLHGYDPVRKFKKKEKEESSTEGIQLPDDEPIV